MARLVVEFLPDRNRCGGVSLYTDRGKRLCGPFPVAGRGTDALAAINANPARHPLRRYGDTPTGSFIVRRLLKSGAATPFPAERYGPHGLVVLEGVCGDAALAEANGRFHFLVAGGALGPGNRLRSTAGGLRLKNEHMRVLMAALRDAGRVSCEIDEREALPDRGAVFVDAACNFSDPVPLPVTQARAAPRAQAYASATSVAGAILFGFSVSFVALESLPAQAAVGRVSELNGALPNQRLAFGGPARSEAAAAAGGYASLAYAQVDVNAFVKYIDAGAPGTQSKRSCAHACSEALKAAGMNMSGRPEEAYAYGGFVEKHGAIVVDAENYVPKPGDLMVFPASNGHPHGHVQVYDGKGWVSDFRQPNMLPWRTAPPGTVYRFPQSK